MPLELGSDAIQASAVELMIARNVEHGLVEVPGPGHSLAWTGDVEYGGTEVAYCNVIGRG